MKRFKISNYVFVGTILEHLDNILFALFLPVLTEYFFSTSNVNTKWLLAFTAFGLYFVVRPLGALIFGVIGDKFGRRVSLCASVFLMSLATLLIGLLPSYSKIGSASSVIFLILRIFQGLSVGGEYGSAMTYIYENSPPNKKTFFAATLIAATHLGGVIAALFSLVSYFNFKYIFIIAGLVGLMSLKGRLSLSDSYKPSSKQEFTAENASHGIAVYFKQYLYVFALSSCLVAIFYTTIVYFNKLAIVNLAMTKESVRLLNLVLLSIWLLFSPIVGYVIDLRKISCHAAMRFASLSIMIFVSIAIIYFAHNSYNIYLFIGFQVIVTIFHIIFCTPTPRLICAVFAKHTRNTNAAVSYSLGSSFTAAIISFANNYMYKYFTISGVGMVIIAFAFIGFLACLKKEKL